MKYGANIFLLRPQQVVDVALQAEKLGYDSIWFGEHVITPAQNESKFPYAGDFDTSHADFNAQIPFYDTYAAIGYLAALTKTLKLGVSVSIVPLHDPFHLSRSIATLDIFSQGRFILGIGTGWLKEEFDIMGVDFATRGKRLEEMLDIMISLFNNEVTTYDGEHFKIPPIGLNPKPITRPHPPFHIGGNARPALRRAALRGDGWVATALSPDELKVKVEEIRRMRAEAGRDGVPFEITCGVAAGGKELTRDQIERYREAGADRLLVAPWNRGSEAADGLARFADKLF